MRKIVVIGSSNMDMVIHLERLPRPGETVLGGKFLMSPGGKGANQAVAAARLGSSTAFITKLGSDMFGNELKTIFINEGIDNSGILTDHRMPSGIALINVDNKGENCISVAQGANAELSVDDIKQLSHLIDEADIVLMQLEIPIKTVVFIANYANRKNKKVIINPAPASNLPDATLKKLFAITPNETETELLTGIVVNDEKSAAEACKVLYRKGVQNVIITMGDKGAYLFNSEYSGIIAVAKVEAIDTTAAGDVFNGALAAALSEGYTIYNAVEYACRAAAIAVTRIGAQASAPYKSELIHPKVKIV